jgi:hypothetical protein
MPLKFTLHRPIAWQKFDWRNRSENSRTWCWNCNAGVLDEIHRECAWLFYRALGMHAERGWSRLYAAQKLLPLALALLALLAGLLALRAVRALRSRLTAAASAS